MKIAAVSLPDGVLLGRYRGAAYTDCFITTVSRAVTLPEFVNAFYSSGIFRLERFILARFGHRSTDQDIRALASGAADRFAAWRVEGRGEAQLLLCDLAGRTRSWLMVEPDGAGTRLYFGSAVISRSAAMRALLAFHKVYSRMLLRAAARRLHAR